MRSITSLSSANLGLSESFPSNAKRRITAADFVSEKTQYKHFSLVKDRNRGMGNVERATS